MLKFLATTLLAAAMALPASAAENPKRMNVGWSAYRDLTDQQFSQRFEQLSDRGMRMIDVEAYPTAGGMRYAMIWEENDGRGWAEHRNMTDAQYSRRWAQYRDRGFRPTDVEAYRSGSSQRYAGIWVQNRENIAWSSWRNMTSASYGEKFQEMSGRGYYLVDMEAYQTSSGLRYAAIWYRNTRNIAWSQLRNMSREAYQRNVNEKAAQGYRLVDYERYRVRGSTRYAAIWHRDGSPARIIRTNRNATQYANFFREYNDDGYRPVDFERDGSSYGAVWAKVTPARADYRHRRQIDRKLADYLSSNAVAGLSAAIYHEGRLVYRGGVGRADRIARKNAHGKTVYLLASVSKVIGATLFARLEERGRLQNGRRFDLDANDPTRRYLPEMPAHHTHTLRDLMRHRGCVPHYNTSPRIANQRRHYTTQRSAAASFWNRRLINGCKVGVDRNYSTPASTLVAAAMESATGRSTTQLLSSELTRPFNLPSMRVMFASPRLPSNYERAVGYSGNLPRPYGNNSWKIFGGGIEANAIDLARFGWLTVDARLTSQATLDNRLFDGYNWGTATLDGRRVARHNGSWNGAARSNLTIWRDDGLSIALLSNQSGHDGLADLAEEIGDMILDAGS